MLAQTVPALLLALSTLLAPSVLAQVPDPGTPPNAPKIPATPDPRSDFNPFSATDNPAVKPKKSKTAVVNVNAGTADQLQQLEGVDAAKAEKIILSRPYTFLNDLINKGIFTDEELKAVRPQLTLLKSSSPPVPAQKEPPAQTQAQKEQ